MVIPSIVHQMWLDPNDRHCPQPPIKYRQYAESWKWMYGSGYKFWNMADIDELFHLYPSEVGQYRQFFYNVLREHIERCDFARYMLMALFGGIYADLKISIDGPIHDMLDMGSICFLFNIHNVNTSSVINIFRKPNLNSVTNAFLVSSNTKDTKRFWFGFLDEIVQTYASYKYVHESTGPWKLTDFHMAWRDRLSFAYIAHDPIATLQYRFLNHCQWDMRVQMSSKWYLQPKQLVRLVYWALRTYRDLQLLLAIGLVIGLLCLIM